MIEQHRPCDDAQVSRNDTSQGQLHDVTWDDIGYRRLSPLTVTPHAHLRRQALLQQFESRIRMGFLENTEPDVEQQQSRDHQRLKPLTDHELQRDSGLEHPRHGRPEMAHDALEGMQTFLDNSVRPELQHPTCGLRRRQSRWNGVRMPNGLSVAHACPPCSYLW